jgi:hypothetical protein
MENKVTSRFSRVIDVESAKGLVFTTNPSIKRELLNEFFNLGTKESDDLEQFVRRTFRMKPDEEIESLMMVEFHPTMLFIKTTDFRLFFPFGTGVLPGKSYLGNGDGRIPMTKFGNIHVVKFQKYVVIVIDTNQGIEGNSIALAKEIL